MIAATLTLPVPLTLSTRWRHAALAVLVALLWILICYRDTALSMVLIWRRSDTFAHGFLVVPIVAWLVWRQRHDIARHAPQPSPGVLPMLALMGLIWLVGEVAAANTLTQAALVGLLVLSVPLLLGWPVARCIAFPLGFLFFAVPMGEFLLPQLMEWTTNFTVWALRLSGVPVYREGLNFVIPSGRWSVVEACSGVRYLIASITVGTLYAYLSYQSLRRRLLFVAASVFVPVFANWVRAYMIVMLAHLSNNRLATGVDHLLYGWIFFGIVVALMFGLGSRWAQPEPRRVPPLPSLQAMESGPYMPAPLTSLWLCGVALVGMSALPHLVYWSMGQNAESSAMAAVDSSAATRTLAPPTVLGNNWTLQAAGDDVQMPHFKPAYQNPSFDTQGVYVAPGSAVGLYIGAYLQQTRGHALVSSDNVLVSSHDPHWLVVGRSTRSTLLDAHAVTMRVSELRTIDSNASAERGTLRAWQVTWVNGTLTHSDYIAKALGALHRLTGKGDAAAVIVIYTRESSPGQGDAALAAFWRDNYATINALLLRHTGSGSKLTTAPDGAPAVKGKEVMS